MWANICCPLRLPTKMLITSRMMSWPGIMPWYEKPNYPENEVITRETSRECPCTHTLLVRMAFCCWHKIDSITRKLLTRFFMASKNLRKSVHHPHTNDFRTGAKKGTCLRFHYFTHCGHQFRNMPETLNACVDVVVHLEQAPIAILINKS